MRRFIVITGWLASLGLLLAACGAPTPAPTATVASDPSQKSPQAGEKAPDFTLADANGSQVNLATVAAKNKSAVLVFYLSHT
jgi:uncharacterized protein YcfL